MGRFLGQHFLISRPALTKIVGTIAPQRGETIIEIGGGHGELTSHLGDTDSKIIAIEKDARLAHELQEKFKENKAVEIVEGDALKILPTIPKTHHLKLKSYIVVGNLPYYITGRFLRIVGTLVPRPRLAVVTLQKEVGERMCTTPPHMNRLAAIVQSWAKPSLMAIIPRTAFRPAPEVDSVIVKLETYRNPPPEQFASYERAVKTLFQQPRKTIVNNLRAALKISPLALEKILLNMKIHPMSRPQDLNIAQIFAVSRLFRLR